MRYSLCFLGLFAITTSSITESGWCLDREIVPAAVTKSKSPETTEIREFEVRVDNRATGSHQLSITCDEKSQTCQFQTDVRVDVIVYAYVFKFRGTEIWRAGIVDDSDIRCDDAGKKRTFLLKTESGSQQVAFNGKPAPLPSSALMTTAYWKLPSEEKRQKAFWIVDIDTGLAQEARLTLVGPETMTVGSQSIASQHFKIDGPSPADLWFDDQGFLVRQKSVESGHAMELKLKQIRLMKEDQ